MSKGVAILMPSYLDIKVNKVECDSDGRLIVLMVTVEENEFVLGNIYAPTKDKVAQQNTFITYLISIIETYSDKNMLIGGISMCALILSWTNLVVNLKTDLVAVKT